MPCRWRRAGRFGSACLRGDQDERGGHPKKFAEEEACPRGPGAVRGETMWGLHGDIIGIADDHAAAV
ncbi:MAG: hypothetical protein B7X59_15660 [Polaromonas sp. 39-63-203]|nr:MAG: hypothetical protein B7X59_15660 [Polaromonas sp. 39-63-203]